MRIDTFVYQQMLQKFLTDVWDNELTKDQQEMHLRGSETIWEITDPGKDGTNFFDRLFLAPYSFYTATNHFTRKIDRHTGDTVPIKPEYLNAILTYIGIELPGNISLREVSTEQKKADKLYEIYKKYLLDNKPISPDIFENSQFSEERIVDSEKVEKELQKLFENFVVSLTEGRYKDAENMWFPVNYKRMAGNLFISDICKNSQVKGLSLSNILSNYHFIGQNEAVGQIFWWEVIPYESYYEIEKLRKYDLTQIDSFIENLKQLKEKLTNDEQYSHFIKSKIIDTLGMPFQDYLKFHPPKKEHLVLPNFVKIKQHLIDVPRLFQVKFERANNIWYFSAAKPINTNALDQSEYKSEFDDDIFR